MVRWDAALLLSGLSLASAQTYTITETVDACPASYSNAPSTVTVQSSVTVTPTPLTDANLNAGTPFVIQVAQYSTPGALSTRAAPVYSWLTANGSLTNTNSSAAQYHITGGRLFTSSGLCVSANTSTAQTILAASPACGPFSGNFTFENDMLNWTNSAFFDGAAQFFGEYNATSNATQVMAMLNGLLSGQQLANRLVLYGRAAVASTSASASSTVGQASSLSSYVQPSASASLVSTPNGVCGGASGYTCAGASFGTCCSAYGFCGSSADYCGTGCQTGFGACGVSSQSVSSSSTGAMSAPVAMSSMPVYANTSARASMSTHLGPGPAYPDSSSMSSSAMSSLDLPAYTSQASSSMTTSSVSLEHYSPAGSSSTTMRSVSSSTSSTSSTTTTTSLPGGGYFSAPAGTSTPTTSTTPSAVHTSSSSTSSAMSSSLPDAYTTTSTTASSSLSAASTSPSGYTTTSQTTTSSTTTSSTTTTFSTTTSSALSAYTPTSSYVSTPATCPADNNTVVQDSNGVQYAVQCAGDTLPQSYTSRVAANTWNDCFPACDGDCDCMSFTYVGNPDGTEGGTCYFKTMASPFISNAINYIAGNRLTPRPTPASACTSAVSSTSMVAPSSSTSSSTVATSSSTSSSTVAPSSSPAAVASSTTSLPPTTVTGYGAGYTPTPTICDNFGSDPPGTDEDDSYCEIDLPFNISMYNGRGNTNQTFVTTNGVRIH